MSAFSGYGATSAQVEELFHILTVMRPHGSKMEERFIKHYFDPLKPLVDKCGNLIINVGDVPILWSSHIDTVHAYGGLAPIKLSDGGVITRHPKSQANCLGADDGVGVWLMLQMIRAERPGRYVFHRGEEKGGIGSRWIAKNCPKLLDGIEAAIAFDRKDNNSIITHQFGGRCCSEDFSASLSKAIGLGMKSDDGGSFTDTASYTDLVGECTNVSVGYKGQHGRTEEQDLMFLLSLLDQMLVFDASALTFKRKPGEKEPYRYKGSYYGGSGGEYIYNAYTPKLKWERGKVWDRTLQGYVHKDKVWDATTEKWVAPMPAAKNARAFMDTSTKWKVGRKKTVDSPVAIDTHLALVKDYPEEIAAILEERKYGLAYLHEQIAKHGGVCTTCWVEAAPKGNSTEDIFAEEDQGLEGGKVPDEFDGPTCSRCYRLRKFCCCH